MQIHWITPQTGWIDNASAMGICRLGGDGCLLIDTGLDDDAARKVLKLIQEQGMTLTHVINTHSHADHCGGNHLLQKRTGAHFMAPAGEKGVIEWPMTEPHYLYGAYPPKALRSKFLLAKPSVIHETLTDGKLALGGRSLQVLPLAGHSPDMKGILTEDGVLFAADAVFSRTVAEKYRILYHYRLEQVLETLDFLATLSPAHVVLSHGGYRPSLDEDLKANRSLLEQVDRWILDQAMTGIGKTALHQRLCIDFGIEETLPTHYLNDSLLSSHLSSLVNRSRLEMTLESGDVVYKTL